MAELHALLMQRDAEIARLQVEATAQGRNLVDLRALLTHRDEDILGLRAELDILRLDLTELRARLGVRNAEISQFAAEVVAKDGDLIRSNRLISDLYASKSWRATKPLRWGSRLIRRLVSVR
jgi:hypothetical protein